MVGVMLYWVSSSEKPCNRREADTVIASWTCIKAGYTQKERRLWQLPNSSFIIWTTVNLQHGSFRPSQDSVSDYELLEI
jgi:hypothetical protein